MALTHELQHVATDRGLDTAHWCSIQTSSLMAVAVERMSREKFLLRCQQYAAV